MTILFEIWNYKIQLFPVLLFLLIYEIPAIIRRMTKTLYFPIYFAVYPLRQINQPLSKYLDDDYFIGNQDEMTDKEAELLRKRINLILVLSGFIDAVIIPLFIGFIAAFFLSETLFYQFLYVLLIYKTITIIMSLFNSHLHIINSKYKILLLSFIYMIYISLIYQMLITSYFWVTPFIFKGDWKGLWNNLLSIVIGKMLVGGILYSVLLSLFSNAIADRQLREENVSKNRK